MSMLYLMIKKILLCIPLSLALIASVYASSPSGTYVISQLDSGTIYVNDVYTSIIPVRIPTDRVISVPSDMEAGIMIHVQCESGGKVSMRLVTPSEVDAFNTMYEDFQSRVVAYDADFIQTLKTKYQQSPVENYLLKALLNSTLTMSDFMSLQYNQWNAYSTKTIDELCADTIDNTRMWWPDWFFLQTMGKDIVSGTTIISRKERWANENLSKPKAPSTGTVETGSTNTRAGESSSTNQTIKQNYITYFNATDKKKVISYTTNPDWRPLEYFPVNRIIIHHTAGEYAATTSAGEAYMRTLQKYHASIGRGDIGYHFLIDGAGNMYEWRRWWMQSVWAHVLGHNRWSVGISLMSSGKYSVPMLVSLVKLTLYLGEEYGIDVTGKGMFRNANVTALEEWPTVVAHKELTPLKPDDPEINMNVFRKILEKVQKENPHLIDSMKK